MPRAFYGCLKFQGGTYPQTPLDGVLSLMSGYIAPPDFQNSNFAPPLKIFLDEIMVILVHTTKKYGRMFTWGLY